MRRRNDAMIARQLTASLRCFAAFRLMHLPHHVQPITAASAIVTPAAVPPAIAATGIVDVTGFETAPRVGKLLPEVIVVVTNEGEAGTLIVVNTEARVCVGVAVEERDRLWVTSVDVGGMGMGRWGRSEEPGKEKAGKGLVASCTDICRSAWIKFIHTNFKGTGRDASCLRHIGSRPCSASQLSTIRAAKVRRHSRTPQPPKVPPGTLESSTSRSHSQGSLVPNVL